MAPTIDKISLRPVVIVSDAVLRRMLDIFHHLWKVSCALFKRQHCLQLSKAVKLFDFYQ